MEVICNPTLRAAAGVQWRRAGASAMPIADLFRVMSACFDRKISFSGCNGVAGVPYFQTDRCGGKMNDDSSTEMDTCTLGTQRRTDASLRRIKEPSVCWNNFPVLKS
ncbi:hypothetical protein T05_5762 [Trichinella murrelli]|uniref:Uncharacterized protein n=2 Tax=Trichinella TaxID=6333 RepID=A0A0V0U6F8_9BILA|nr:hypothetical protein T05_5762 [Trichinella murrelli]